MFTTHSLLVPALATALFTFHFVAPSCGGGGGRVVVVGETIGSTGGNPEAPPAPGRAAGPITGGATDLTGGGGGYSARTGARGDDADVMTHIQWMRVVLTQPRTLTGNDAEAAADLDAHLAKVLRMRRSGPRPTLLYIHHPHDVDHANDHAHDGEEDDHHAPLSGNAKKSHDLCDAFDDETVARWSKLYRLVMVDAGESDADLLRRFSTGDGPALTVIGQDLKVVAATRPMRRSKEITKFLARTAEDAFPEYWKTVQRRLADQDEALSTARTLAKDKDYKKAIERLWDVTKSELRITSTFDAAVKFESELRRKLTR